MIPDFNVIHTAPNRFYDSTSFVAKDNRKVPLGIIAREGVCVATQESISLA